MYNAVKVSTVFMFLWCTIYSSSRSRVNLWTLCSDNEAPTTAV